MKNYFWLDFYFYYFQMSRARTPFGAVPISTIYGYEYPLGSKVGPTVETSLTSASKHE